MMALRRKMPRLKVITFMHTCCEGHDVGLGLRRFPAHAHLLRGDAGASVTLS